MLKIKTGNKQLILEKVENEKEINSVLSQQIDAAIVGKIIEIRTTPKQMVPYDFKQKLRKLRQSDPFYTQLLAFRLIFHKRVQAGYST